MRIERNISYFENSDLPYQIAIERNHSKICESFDSLEAAIDARDEIEKNYSISQELKHSSKYEIGLKSLACKRFSSDSIVRIPSASDACYRYAAVGICKICNRENKYISVKRYQIFLKRGQLCQSCYIRDRAEEIASKLHNRKESYSSNRTTGIKNICFIQSRQHYLLTIHRNHSKYRRIFKDLNAAVEHKSQVLRFYQENHRLPSRDEI